MTKNQSLTSWLYTLLICCFCFCASSGFAVQYENQIIDEINVEVVNLSSDSNFDTDSVRARIKSKLGNPFSQMDFDNDLKTLARDFDRVEPTISSINDHLIITLKIWPKPTIRSIHWEGNHHIKTSKLLDELDIKTGTIFERRDFTQAFQKLKLYYIKKGYFEAQLDYKVVLDPLCNQVDIEVTILEGRAGRIKEIVFVNFHDCEVETLLNMMVTKEYNFFTSWMTEEGTYHEEAVQQDHFVLLNFLQNEGYADAKIDISVVECDREDRIVIYIKATKGERYYFGPLAFEGNTLFPDDGIWDQFLFSEGDPYSPEAIRETVNNIMDLYGRSGYIDAIVDFEPRLLPNQNVYSLNFKIEEGEQYRVGLIKVFGNTSTMTNVILHETLLIPGEIFNIDKIKITEARLENIGYFKFVNVYAVRSEGPCSLGGNYRDVHIEVEETNTGHFGAFFGFSTVESIFGGFNITERNFNYKGLRNCWTEGYRALRGGGEYAHFTTTIGAKSRSYVLSWTKPYFMDTPWIVGFDIENSNNRYISKEYEVNSTGFSLHAAYPVNPFVRIGWTYRLKHATINFAGDTTKDLRHEARHNGMISAIGHWVSYDSTNNPMVPTRGFKSRFEVEVAGFGGNYAFANVSYTNGYFYQFWFDTKGVWKFRADARFIQTLGKTERQHLPLEERLFLGGPNMIRGYRAYRLGPQFPHSHDPSGGVSLQLLSMEYARPIFSRLEGFLFCDSGHLSMKNWNFGRLSTAAGYGVRIKIIENTPLVLGMGYPINPRNRSEVKRFFLTVGGSF